MQHFRPAPVRVDPPFLRNEIALVCIQVLQILNVFPSIRLKKISAYSNPHATNAREAVRSAFNIQRPQVVPILGHVAVGVAVTEADVMPTLVVLFIFN